MRLSRPDENDPTKRRHFEISIDSPFNILSCRATQANTSLPVYASSNIVPSPTDEFDCGCPGAALRRRTSPSDRHVSAITALRQGNSSSTSVDTIPSAPSRSWTSNSEGLARPVQAHVHNDLNSGRPRPMHLLRSPSFNPPPFDDEDPPPPLVTPPPNYENVVGGDSTSGLADYFARLADEIGDEFHSPGHVEISLTPGRHTRSMDLPRGQWHREWQPHIDTASTLAASSASAQAAPAAH